MKCEFCGMQYPDGEWQYYYIKVWDKEHIICSDCYKMLMPIIYEKDKKKYPEFCDKVRKDIEDRDRL